MTTGKGVTRRRFIATTAVGGPVVAVLDRAAAAPYREPRDLKFDAGARPSGPAEQWRMVEITVRSTTAYANPFRDVWIEARISIGGFEKTVAGFYAGDSEGVHLFKVRYMPDRPGLFQYSLSSQDRAINGKTGSFVVSPAAPDNHGPVGVSRQTHFAYADGTPYFLLGTTIYNWLSHKDELQHRTLATLKNTSFNKVRFFIFPKWFIFNQIEPRYFAYIRRDNGEFDFDRFDTEFFERLENNIRLLGEIGVQADLILFHYQDKWGFSTMSAARNETYLRYVGARLSAFQNVWWTMANEYNFVSPRDWDRLHQVMRESDPYGHPLGIHNAGQWYDHAKPWITHAVIQNGTDTAGISALIARKRYAKPAVIDEYGYEGNTGAVWGDLTGPEELGRHWDIAMAGGYGSHGETYVHPGGILWWSAGGELVGQAPVRLGFLKQVMTELPFQSMVPAPGVVKGGTALAQTGNAYLFHFKTPGPNQIRIEGGGIYQVELIDPWLMEVHVLGHTTSGTQEFSTPVVPCLLRLTAAPAGKTPAAQSISQLVASFVGAPAPNAPSKSAAFIPDQLYYSVDFQILQLKQDSRTSAILARYMPDTMLGGVVKIMLPILQKYMPMEEDRLRAVIDVLTVREAQKFAKLDEAKFAVLSSALAAVPVAEADGTN